MTILSAPNTHRAGGEAESRFRRTVNVVLLVAVLLDFAGQALGLFGSGSVPLVVLVAMLAVAALVVGIVSLRHR